VLGHNVYAPALDSDHIDDGYEEYFSDDEDEHMGMKALWLAMEYRG
jgi:hypothetical protein